MLIFAATTIIGKLSSLSAPVLISWRCLLATAGALLWARLVSTRQIWLGWNAVGRLWGVGLLIGIHWLCLFGAVKVANVSIALAGLATLSLFTALVEPVIIRRRVSRHEILLGLLVLAGIVLIAGAEWGHLTGLLLALASALLAALFMCVNKRIVVGGADPLVMVGWEMMSATAICLLAGPLFDPTGLPALGFSDPMDWFWLLVLAFGCTVFAQELTNRLLREISPYKFNLAANFEPVYGIVAAAIIFGEHEQLRPTFYLGAVAIMLANLIYPRVQRMGSRAAPLNRSGNG